VLAVKTKEYSPGLRWIGFAKLNVVAVVPLVEMLMSSGCKMTSANGIDLVDSG